MQFSSFGSCATADWSMPYKRSAVSALLIADSIFFRFAATSECRSFIVFIGAGCLFCACVVQLSHQ
ncbi:MAG: hypothetical protein ACLRL4_04455 [Bifidobacterium bifidum]